MTTIREPYGYSYAETSRLKEVYGGAHGRVFVECMRIYPEGTDSKTVILFSHPIGGGSFLPLVNALARAGKHVIYCNTRYRGNDTALILEKCVMDLGVCVADLKKRFGYEKVVLGGWSGGGSLSLFYQDQAMRPTITETPAGDPADLTAAGLQPADGLMLLAAHISRSVTLTEWMDPSILDEDRPFERDPGLNIYAPDCPAQPPYSAEFVARFRELPGGLGAGQPAANDLDVERVGHCCARNDAMEHLNPVHGHFHYRLRRRDDERVPGCAPECRRRTGDRRPRHCELAAPWIFEDAAEECACGGRDRLCPFASARHPCRRSGGGKGASQGRSGADLYRPA